MKFTALRMIFFVSYAIPVVALVAPVGTYLPAFYASISNLSLSQIGVIFLLLKVFDVISDVTISILIDASPWKTKYKPWLLISIPISCLGAWLMYLPNEGAVDTSYLVISGFTLYLGYTIATLSSQAWGSEMFPGAKGLATFFGYREVAVILGILFVFMIPAIMELLYQADLALKVRSAGYLLLLMTPIFGLLTIFSFQDVKTTKTVDSAFMSNITSLKYLMRKDLLPVVLANASWFFAVSATSAVTPFLLINSFGLSEHLGRFFVIYFISSLLFSMFWVYLIKHFGEIRILRYASAYAMLTSLVIIVLFFYPSIAVLYTLAMLCGVSFAPGPLINRIVSANLSEKIQKESNTAVRAKVFSFLVMSEKLGVALGISLSLALMDWIGYDPKLEISPSTTVSAISIYLGAVIIGYGLVLWAYRKQGHTIIES